MILVSGDPIKCNNRLKYGVDVTTTKYILYPARAFKEIPIHSNHPKSYSRSHMAPSPSGPSPDLPDESGAPLLPRFSKEEEAVSLSLIPIFLHLVSTSQTLRIDALFFSYLRSGADGHVLGLARGVACAKGHSK